jgi:hypothetical protein
LIRRPTSIAKSAAAGAFDVAAGGKIPRKNGPGITHCKSGIGDGYENSRSLGPVFLGGYLLQSRSESSKVAVGWAQE